MMFIPLFRYRLARHFGKSVSIPPNPVFKQDGSFFTDFILENRLSNEEFFLLLLALSPHIEPFLIDKTIAEAIPDGGDFPQLGGVRGKQFRGFLPTGETALFLLAGDDFEQRMEAQKLFGPDHFFSKKKILWLEPPPPGEPRFSGKIVVNPDWVEFFTTGQWPKPHFGIDFPARLVETELDWDDLIISPAVRQQLLELENWVRHSPTLMADWGMARRLKPGYRVLFHGPPGTGKTLTASILGKKTGHEVYRIDLSSVVSKYIGETEKNLATLFDRAEDKRWILFFDEADSLFGKRTGVRDAHDKYANQEVSYLLQRVEDFSGMVILASNMKSNIDDAFLRRFNGIVPFKMPDQREREGIWRKAFPSKIAFQEKKDIPALVSRYELSGAGIVNCVQFACLAALSAGLEIIRLDDVLRGIQREFDKEGRVFRV